MAVVIEFVNRNDGSSVMHARVGKAYCGFRTVGFNWGPKGDVLRLCVICLRIEGWFAAWWLGPVREATPRMYRYTNPNNT